MVERYTLPCTLAGLRLCLHLLLSLRANEFTTQCVVGPRGEIKMAPLNQMLHVEATPAPRPNREARGANL